MLKDVPDEFYNWVKTMREGMLLGFGAVEMKAKEIFEQIKDLPDRKSQALKIMELDKKLANVVFLMLDKRDYKLGIWKQLKPKFELPFKTEI